MIDLEAYRSGHNGPDSKSGYPHGYVGSNPTASVDGTKVKKSVAKLGFATLLFSVSLSIVRVGFFYTSYRFCM